MATVEDFKYSVNTDRVQVNDVTHSSETVELGKVKFFCIYESLSFRVMLRYGKGTHDPTKNITAIFDWNANNLEEFYVLCTFRKGDERQWQKVTWFFGRPLISNYSKMADPKQPEHKFTEFLRRSCKKKMTLTVPAITKFDVIDWGTVRTAYENQAMDMKAMLDLYPHPCQPTKSLPLVSECRLRKATNTFANRDIWGIVMNIAVLRERQVYLRRLQKTNVEDCWGIFEKLDDAVFCHVFAEPAGHDKSQILNPCIGDQTRLNLRFDGYHELSIDATVKYTQAVITEVTKRSDFVLRLLGDPGWTEKDLNFGRMSTIRLERTNVYMAITRHQEAIENCFKIHQTATSFPLTSLLLLNQRLPSVIRPEITPSVWEILRAIHAMLNPTQQQAFRECHSGSSPIVLIQGPPGTGKSLTLAVIAHSLAMRRLKCVICTPSNNANNEIAEKTSEISGDPHKSSDDPHKRPYRRPNIIRWLTPANNQAIMNNGRAPGIPETMVEMSMARRMQVRVRQSINSKSEGLDKRAAEKTAAEKRAAREWLDLWRRRKVLNQSELGRFKELTFLWENQILGETDIVITTCDNSYTLDPDAFPASVVIIDECSQAIEPAALLPITRFVKNLQLVVLGGDDQQLQPFALSTPADNEFQPQLRKSWFERVRLSTVVPCITLGQQYRMRPEISRIIINHFYPGKLQNDISTSIQRPVYVEYMKLAKALSESKPEWAASQWPLANVLMVDMPEGTRTWSKFDATGSRYNSGHILIVRDLCLTILAPSSGIHHRDLAIITPYSAQRVRIIRALEQAAKDNPALNSVVVSTVDKFQGQECGIIILDLVVRSNRNTSIGFMADKNRLNVGLSRARDVLIVIGDAHKYKRLLSKSGTLKQTRLFLEIMCDIATTTVLWKGDTSDIKDIDTWDTIQRGNSEEELEGEVGKEKKTGDFQTNEAGPKWRY